MPNEPSKPPTNSEPNPVENYAQQYAAKGRKLGWGVFAVICIAALFHLLPVPHGAPDWMRGTLGFNALLLVVGFVLMMLCSGIGYAIGAARDRSIDQEAADANNRGVKLRASGDLDGAIREYTAAIGIKPTLAEAFTNRASVLFEMGNLNAALQDLNVALQLKPSDADGYYNRAKVLEQIGNSSAAIADFGEYLDLGGGKRSGDTEEVLRFIANIQKQLQASK